MKRIIPFILTMILLFTACSNSNGKNYILTHVYLDGEEVDGQSGMLILNKDNSGTITFNDTTSNFNYDSNQSKLSVNDLEGTLLTENDNIKISFKSIGLDLVYAETNDSSTITESSAISGKNYEGRMYYTECEGNFADYDLSSAGVHGTVTDNKISIYCDAYSTIIPMLSLDYENDECKGGYLMAFPIDEYEAKISRSTQNAEDVNNTEFINPEEYIWNKYDDSQETAAPENVVDVLTIEGTVRNSDGGFTYKVLLTPSAD